MVIPTLIVPVLEFQYFAGTVKTAPITKLASMGSVDCSVVTITSVLSAKNVSTRNVCCHASHTQVVLQEKLVSLMVFVK